MGINFANQLPFLPDMVDDESLYGWTGHYHRLSGNLKATTSSVQLFGNNSAGFKRDFPLQLDHFAEVTNSMFGDAETLAYERSLLGFYAPFQTEDFVRIMLQKMRGIGNRKSKADLIILPGKHGVSRPLKACPECIKADIAQFSIAKWYLAHQWPVSWFCSEHCRPLRAVRHGWLQGRQYNFLLAGDIAENEWEDAPEILPAQSENWIKVGNFCANLFLRRHYHLDVDLLRYAYLYGAKIKFGWTGLRGSLNSVEIWKAFQSHYSQLESLPGFKRGDLNCNHPDFILLLMQKSIQKQHPIRHLLFMSFLFDSIKDFDNIYDQVRIASIDGGISSMQDLLTNGLHKEIRRHIEDEKMSIWGTAKALNISRDKVSRFVEANHINYSKTKPPRLYVEHEEKLKKLIMQGIGRREIAKQIGIKRSHIERYLFERPILRDIWKMKNLERIRSEYRTNYLSLVSGQRLDSITGIQRHPNNRFWWLRKHDLEWLIENSPTNVSLVLIAKKNGSD
jgi:hypothetical protein